MVIRPVSDRFGQPRTATGTPLEMVVLGMGKLGGEELNYSSDVDLVYVYGAEADHPSGRPARLFFAKIAEEVTKGYVP